MACEYREGFDLKNKVQRIYFFKTVIKTLFIMPYIRLKDIWAFMIKDTFKKGGNKA